MATATPYISGLKKPLGAIVNPIYPDIKKGPPRFVWSRKFWQVDPGAVARDTEPYTQFIDDAILAQSRSYNKTVYGQSSHKDIVNAEFRPPLLSYYEDIGPLSRVPTKIKAIIPHINPGTADHDGTKGYSAKNERINNVESALTDRIKQGEWRPTFYAPIDIPQDNSVLPDLEMKIPSVSAHAGWQFPSYNTQGNPNVELGEEKLQAIPINSGYSSTLRVDGPSQFENYIASENRPSYSASAGMNTPFTIDGEFGEIELEQNRPYYSASAGMNTPVQINGETPTIELFHNRPQVSASAGMNTPVTIDGEFGEIELDYNRPQVSASAGMNTPFTINGEHEEIELQEKLGMTPIQVINPGSEEGYQKEVEMYTNIDEFIQENRPSYSYVVPHEEPIFRTSNYQSHKPHFREKLQPEKSYGKIAQSSGAIPRPGVEMYRESLKEDFVRGNRKPSRYEVVRKKKEYRF